MSKEHEKIKHLLGGKSLKAPFIVYTDLECLLKKMSSCKNNPENSYTEKRAKHKPSGYAWCSICSFDDTKNKRYFYRGKDCIEKFCKDLKELGMEIINFEEKEMMPLTTKKLRLMKSKKYAIYVKKSFVMIKTRKSQRSLPLHRKN